MPLHPQLVHFPIALFIFAALAYLLNLIFPQWKLGRTAIFLHVGGLVMGVAALLSGDAAESNMVHNHEIHEMLESHEMYAQFTIYIMAALAIWMFLRHKSKVMIEKIAFVVVFCAACGLMTYAAHIGGEVVYEKGGGVEPMKPIIQQSRDAEGGHNHN